MPQPPPIASVTTPAYVQANTSGLLHDAAQPSIPPLDRGFLYGDAVYEVWRTYSGVLFAFEEHWERLERSARALHFTTGLERQQLLDEIKRTVSAFRAATGSRGELYVRLQVTRGSGAIGLDVRLAQTPRWVLLVRELAAPALHTGKTGLRLHVATRLRRNPPNALDPAWKTGNYLNNLLCLQEAQAAGADDVVMLDQHGRVTEASTSNVFFVEDRTLVTPPLSVGILAGVTRELILREVGPRAGFAAREEALRPSDFPRFRECFLTSTTRDVSPVEAIDEHHFAAHQAATAHLKAAFAAHAAEYAASHPELAV